jgi:hypothetical protein
VNTHLQLLWYSVFAPTAAVDLAKQHPNTYSLGWLYVAATVVVGLACELLVRFVVRPVFGIVVAEQTDQWAWFDSVAGLTVFSIIASILLFLGQRWFWRLFDKRADAVTSIDAAIIAGFALSLVIVLPQYIVTEVTQNSSGPVIFAILMLQVAVYIGFSTLYFSHALNMSLTKSFGLNLLVLVLVVLLSIVIFFLFFVLMSVINGTPLDVLFATAEPVQ